MQNTANFETLIGVQSVIPVVCDVTLRHWISDVSKDPQSITIFQFTALWSISDFEVSE